MKKGILLLSALLAWGSLSSPAQRRTANMTGEEMYLDAMHRNITTEKIFGYVKQLSDPALEGRLAGSSGMAKAVDIVKGYFKQWGLLPGGENGSYIQQFPHLVWRYNREAPWTSCSLSPRTRKKRYGFPKHILGRTAGLPEE